MLSCAALVMIVGASLVAGGLAIAAKKNEKVDEGVLNPGGTFSTLPVPTTDSLISAEGRSSGVEGVGGGESVGVESVSVVAQDDTQADMFMNSFQHSIDSYLRHLPAAKSADTIRKQGFEIQATEPPHPLLEQPQAVEVSTSNFKYNYLEAWFKSLLMFEIQRGGTQVVFPLLSAALIPLHCFFIPRVRIHAFLILPRVSSCHSAILI